MVLGRWKKIPGGNIRFVSVCANALAHPHGRTKKKAELFIAPSSPACIETVLCALVVCHKLSNFQNFKLTTTTMKTAMTVTTTKTTTATTTPTATTTTTTTTDDDDGQRTTTTAYDDP